MVARKGRTLSPLLELRTWDASGAALHPETEPQVIAARHREEVAAYLRRHPEATAEDVSAALILPRWNVERCLAALQVKGAA